MNQMIFVIGLLVVLGMAWIIFELLYQKAKYVDLELSVKEADRKKALENREESEQVMESVPGHSEEETELKRAALAAGLLPD